MWQSRHKLLNLDDLVLRRQEHGYAGEIVAWTNGCFDLLHSGHVASLQAARNLGDVLIVGLNSDSSVRVNKGPSRPILREQERAALLSALECVDYVHIFAEPTPETVLSIIRPDLHCKGAEYTPPHGRPVPERAVVESYGGRIVYLPLLPEISTTDIIAKIQSVTNRNSS